MDVAEEAKARLDDRTDYSPDIRHLYDRILSLERLLGDNPQAHWSTIPMLEKRVDKQGQRLDRLDRHSLHTGDHIEDLRERLAQHDLHGTVLADPNTPDHWPRETEPAEAKE